MSKVNKRTYNKITDIMYKIIDCGVEINTLSHPNHPNSYFVKGQTEDLLIIKEEIKNHFPHCESHLVSWEYSDIFQIFWDELTMNETILEIIIPPMNSTEIIKKCFNE